MKITTHPNIKRAQIEFLLNCFGSKLQIYIYIYIYIDYLFICTNKKN